MCGSCTNGTWLQAVGQPQWRYIDQQGNEQGPFTARDMIQWYDQDYLDKALPVCGMVRGCCCLLLL